LKSAALAAPADGSGGRSIRDGAGGLVAGFRFSLQEMPVMYDASRFVVLLCVCAAATAHPVQAEVTALLPSEAKVVLRLQRIGAEQAQYSNNGFESYAATFQELETGQPASAASASETADAYVYTLRGTDYSCPGDDDDQRDCKPRADRVCEVHGQPGLYWGWSLEAHPLEYGPAGRLSLYIDASGIVRAQDLGGRPGTEDMPELETGTIEDYEAKACRALRALSAAQTNYSFISESHTFAPSLQKLHSGDGAGGKPFISERIASGQVYGYVVTLGVGDFLCSGHWDKAGRPIPGAACAARQDGLCTLHRKAGVYYAWWAEAHPIEYGKTGRRSFYIDDSGLVRGEDVGGKPGSPELPEL
jgi:hypothetical protein